MKAEELRFGNLVLNNDFDIVTEIKEGWQIDSCDFYYRPIPLTEEWLIKFGFVKYGTLHDSYKLNPFIVELGILGNHYTFRKIMNREESILLKEIKYVHQLQNLYFALTNKELNNE